jgi:hypothetical protein
VLFPFKCGLASKVGLRHLSRNNSGGSATPAAPDRRTSRVGASLSRAPSLSLAAQWGRSVGADFLRPRAPSLSLCLVGSDRQSSSRCPERPSFLSLHRGSSCQFRLLRASPWTGACALVHVAGFLGHDARARAQLSSYSSAGAPHTPLTSFRTLSTFLTLCPRRQPPPETRARVPDHPARRRLPQASPSYAPR